MKRSGKISRKRPSPDAPKRSHKRRDAFALNRIPLRRCAYPKCTVEFRPRRKDQVYHSAACRKAEWFDKRYIRIGGEPLSAGDFVFVGAQVKQVGKDGLVQVSILDTELRSVDCFVWKEDVISQK